MKPLIVALLLVPAIAHAQINTEKMRVGAGDPGVSGFLDGSLLYRSGNVDLLQAGAGLRLEYNHGIHAPFVQGDLLYGEKGETEYINRGFVHLRWTAMWHPHAGTELFSQLQFSKFKRLSLRTLGGAGLRVGLWLGDAFEAYLGTGYMIEYEALDLSAEDSHPIEVLHHRWTNYLTLRVNVAVNLALVSTTYAQPRFDAFSDYRVLQEAALEVKLLGSFKLVESFTEAHDSRPPDGVDSTDISTKTSLRVTF